MRIRMNTTYAGPFGTCVSGSVGDFPEHVARQLIQDGAAVAADIESPESVEATDEDQEVTEPASAAPSTTPSPPVDGPPAGESPPKKTKQPKTK